MTPDLGRFALLVTLVAACVAAVSGFIGAARRRERATRSAEGALQGAAIAVTVASACLLVALFRKDFSVEYVWEYTSRDLSLFYTLGAFWAGQAGSLLLWSWMLGIAGAVVVAQGRSRSRELMTWAVPVIGVVLAFFAFLTLVHADPFARTTTIPADGQGLNPLLQNYGQWVHPLALYAGWVGFTVPFAFAIAALVTGRLDDEWVRRMRKWALWAWILLTAGILFGARWAYVELGWGGYWAWDPVENASFLPWLTATAYLHSAVVQEKRGSMKAWNVALITATFALSIFGTFLTRSGVISSVHAFAESTMGPLLIGFTLLIVVSTTLLTIWRLPRLRGAAQAPAIVSRESSFLLTALLFVAMTVVVFWGTIYPLVVRATRGTEVSVAAPFFERLMSPLALLTILLVGLCPLLAWRRTRGTHLWRSVKVPLWAGTAGLALGLVAFRGHHPAVVLTFGLSAFALTTVIEELQRGLHARRTVHGETRSRALRNLFALTPRRYSGPLVHAGVVVMLLGIAVNVAFKQTMETTLQVGHSARAGAYQVAFDALTFDQTTTKFSLIGTFRVTAPDGTVTSIGAEQVSYANQQTVTEVGIDATASRDLYLVMSNADVANQVATVQFFVEPAVLWIWVGMLIVVLAGVLAAIPRRANMQIPEPAAWTAPVAAEPDLVGASEGRP